MDNDEQISPIGGSTVEVPMRMLRRLKRASSISDLCPGSITVDSEVADLGSAERFDEAEEEDETRSDLEGVTARKALDFDSTIEDLGGRGDEETTDSGVRVLVTEKEPLDSVVDESSEKIDEEMSDSEIREEFRVSVTKEPLDSVAEGLSEKIDEEMSDSEIREEIRVLVTKEAEKERLNSVVEELSEKIDEEMSDSEIREEIRVSVTEEVEKEPLDSVVEELSEKSEEEMFNSGIGEEVSGPITSEEGEEEMKDWETRKKRSVLGGDKEKKRSEKRSKKSDGFDELPVSSMNMTKKERREHLDQLRAENHRLLRETRDAAFEPVPLVRKPISSVLEKIRRRKEEIYKQFLSRKKSKYADVCDEEDMNGFEEVVVEEKNDDTKLKAKSTESPAGNDSVEEDAAGPSGNLDSPVNREAESSPTHKDPSSPSQTTSSGDEILEKRSGRSLEEVMTPSILTMNLKMNLSPAPNKSSEEAEQRKENSDFETQDSSPGDPVRKFIDEDAEEEDDSDNDLLRFEDEDEDGDEEDDDDLRDMIVSQFKEDPKDKDRRNELHQKWLEQEDAAGTEKLLQKLKRGMQQDKTSLSEDEEEDDADEEERAENADDEEVTKPGANEDGDEEEDPSNAISMRMKIKKIKEMIPLMFTEENGAYVSSDDEEIEKKLLQQRLYKKMEQKTKSSSVTGDENFEEVLRYIKKPEIMKKAKPSFKDRALMGINKNPAASKSSFLSRITKKSISEGSRKRGSNIVRGYIFERGDSNSKTSNSAPEEPSVPETIIQEKSRPRQAPAKFTASQTQERSATLKAKAVEEETSTRQRKTLVEYLKMSSKKTSFTSSETVITSSHTESIFAAFKLDKKAVKTNP